MRLEDQIEAHQNRGLPNLQAVATQLADSLAGVSWSLCVRDLASGELVADLDSHAVGPIASVGKLLLLFHAAARLEDGSLDGAELLRREREDLVGDSGLWQHLAVEALPLADVAALVGAVSDNLATNVLLRRVGLAGVRAARSALGLEVTDLLDRVRDHRGPHDPPTLAVGSAWELAGLFLSLARGEAISPGVSARVLRWLAASVDLSMIPGGLGVDPLAHGSDGDSGEAFLSTAKVSVVNKTGTDAGVRADAGVLRLGEVGASYAVIARWDPGLDLDVHEHVLDPMRRFGRRLVEHLRRA